MLVATIFDFFVWIHCGHIKVFDDEEVEANQGGEVADRSETELKQVRR